MVAALARLNGAPIRQWSLLLFPLAREHGSVTSAMPVATAPWNLIALPMAPSEEASIRASI